jgi:hypothetical protein
MAVDLKRLRGEVESERTSGWQYEDDKDSGQRNQQRIFLCMRGNGSRRGATNQSDASKNKKAIRLQNGWLGLTSFASA